MHLSISPEEVEEVTRLARRLAAIALLEPALNANYQSIKANPYVWPGLSAVTAG
jgi:hypothetical protein